MHTVKCHPLVFMYIFIQQLLEKRSRQVSRNVHTETFSMHACRARAARELAMIPLKPVSMTYHGGLESAREEVARY